MSVSIKFVLPPRDVDFLSENLRILTGAVAKALGDEACRGFGLGGENGYGEPWETEVFAMHPFCWCGGDECPWCSGCDCEGEYLVDGKVVTFNKWVEFFKRFTNGLKYGTDAYKKAAEVADARRDYRITAKCDFCENNAKFSAHGAMPGRPAPHFWHKPSGFRVWWYKYIGRDMETINRPDDERLSTLFAECHDDVHRALKAKNK